MYYRCTGINPDAFHKIRFIKVIRAVTGVGLKEAKEHCEAILTDGVRGPSGHTTYQHNGSTLEVPVNAEYMYSHDRDADDPLPLDQVAQFEEAGVIVEVHGLPPEVDPIDVHLYGWHTHMRWEGGVPEPEVRNRIINALRWATHRDGYECLDIVRCLLNDGYTRVQVRESVLWPDPHDAIEELNRLGVQCGTEYTPTSRMGLLFGD